MDVGFNKEVAEDGALYWGREEGSLAQLINKADHLSSEEIAELGKKLKNEYEKNIHGRRFLICTKQYGENDMSVIYAILYYFRQATKFLSKRRGATYAGNLDPSYLFAPSYIIENRKIKRCGSALQ